MPRSPRRCVSVTRRHRAAQPAPRAIPGSWAASAPAASTVTRGRRGSTIAPPRAGVREGRIRGSGGESRMPRAIARSTPRTAPSPALAAACTKRTAPYRPSRSVRAMAGWPYCAARSTSASGCAAPYRMEKPEARCRWANSDMGLLRRRHQNSTHVLFLGYCRPELSRLVVPRRTTSAGGPTLSRRSSVLRSATWRCRSLVAKRQVSLRRARHGSSEHRQRNRLD